MTRPELWGGLECSVVRIGDRWRDEVVETGHHTRPADLDAIFELGIRTLRYPVLWETVSPETPDVADFTWHDARLGRLRKLGMRVVAGLIHHGSGPRYTNLLDPAFAEGLAAHASRVAERYPFINDYIPVNEPLTTARFSALYGHWYPHRRSHQDFARALVNQCRGVSLAMQAIRAINPAARLVQTEDLGKTFSTPPLAYQADYENERRWLTFDLLEGRVGPDHPWFRELVDAGIKEAELLFFVERPCPPDLLGVNHYLTSERFLEHRADACPPGQYVATNGRQRYADLEAVRLPLKDGSLGPEVRLREVFERYDRPVVVTEVHHGCTRDEQLRWLNEVWQAASRLAAQGKDLRAVTVWGLFGSVDWNSLLTQNNGVYEAGVFEARSLPPRPTAIAAAVRQIAAGSVPAHPVLAGPGWWQRDIRFYQLPEQPVPAPATAPPLLLFGADAVVRGFARVASHRGLPFIVVESDRTDGDMTALSEIVSRERPWAVLDFGIRAVAESETSVGQGSAVLAALCAARSLPLATIVGDSVFQGGVGPYEENDRPSPRAVHGSQAALEAELLAAYPAILIVRTGFQFDPWEPDDPLLSILQRLAAGQVTSLDAAESFSVSYLPDLAHVVLDLLIDGEQGMWHLANPGAVSWNSLARCLVNLAGLDSRLVVPGPVSDVYSRVLTSRGGHLMPPLESALARFVDTCEPSWRQHPLLPARRVRSG